MLVGRCARGIAACWELLKTWCHNSLPGRRATLGALHAFLSWIPLGYIFESNLVEVLLQHFPQPPYRNIALQCLTEVRAVL